MCIRDRTTADIPTQTTLRASSSTKQQVYLIRASKRARRAVSRPDKNNIPQAAKQPQAKLQLHATHKHRTQETCPVYTNRIRKSRVLTRDRWYTRPSKSGRSTPPVSKTGLAHKAWWDDDLLHEHKHDDPLLVNKSSTCGHSPCENSNHGKIYVERKDAKRRGLPLDDTDLRRKKHKSIQSIRGGSDRTPSGSRRSYSQVLTTTSLGKRQGRSCHGQQDIKRKAQRDICTYLSQPESSKRTDVHTLSLIHI